MKHRITGQILWVLGTAVFLLTPGCSWMAGDKPPEQTPLVEGTQPSADEPMKASDLLATSEGAKQSHHIEETVKPAEAPTPTSQMPGAATPKDNGPRGTGVAELLWQVPKEQVEKYHLRYGLSDTDMPGYIEIKVDELERKADPVAGTVFRYLLRDIPDDRAIFITLQAENKHGLSAATDPQRISPGVMTHQPQKE